MRRLKKIGIILVVLYLLLVGLTYSFQERLIFFPSKMPMQHEYDFCQPFEEFFLLSEEALNNDAQLFYDYTSNQYDENKIILYGRSFGTGIATRLAAKNKPCRLILESPFSSAVDLGNHRFPILPVSWLSEFRFPSTDYIKEVDCPIYVFHGTNDKVIPYKFAQKLYKAIPGDGKKFYTIEGGGHNYLQDYEAFKNGMKEALN